MRRDSRAVSFYVECRLSNGWPTASSAGPCGVAKYPKRILPNSIDQSAICARLLTPLEAGSESFRGCSRTFGTANWTQFCPGNENGNRPSPKLRRGRPWFLPDGEIEFFLSSEMCGEFTPKKFRGWFFDIYIQGSKKVQL